MHSGKGSKNTSAWRNARRDSSRTVLEVAANLNPGTGTTAEIIEVATHAETSKNPPTTAATNPMEAIAETTFKLVPKIVKICANHLVSSSMSVQKHAGNEKSCVWHATDFADGELLKDKLFCIRFTSVESEFLCLCVILKKLGIYLQEHV
jgi:hypothetical protein